MKNLIIGVAIGVLAMLGIYGVTLMFSDDAGSSRAAMPLPAPGASPQAGAKGGVIDMICELHLDLDGQVALGIQGNEPSRITLAQVDLERQSGWYQGRIAISESRAGNVTVQGGKLVVTRPAMFERFGSMVTQEQFTVDRASGAFEQSLSFKDGRVVKLIKGTCARISKPPF